jgi:hypothetical protein
MANYKAKKAGQTLAAQKKLEEKYDVEERLGTPERLMVWMNAVLGADHLPCPNSQWRKMQFWMRDGVVLCKFINKLREAASLPAIKFQGNAHVPLVAQDNIDTFVKAAVEYGLPESAAFPSLDLYDAHKGAFYNVIVSLNKLGNEANKKGFSPKYQYIESPQANDVHT